MKKIKVKNGRQVRIEVFPIQNNPCAEFHYSEIRFTQEIAQTEKPARLQWKRTGLTLSFYTSRCQQS